MRARKADANQREIVWALRTAGWLIRHTHTVPLFVDLVAYHPARGVIRLIEIKTDKGGLTRSQADMLTNGWPVAIVRSVDDAIKLQ